MYLRPTSLAEAVSALASGDAQILAGGTDFYPALGDRPARGKIVDVTRLRELRGISFEPECIRIGGLTTWTDVMGAPLPRCFDALKAAAREVGSVQIQNRGTVAGNLCNASPAADGVPPLLALDAEVELVSPVGARRVRLDDFILGNRKTQRRADELLVAILIPRKYETAASAFVKLGARRYLVISIAMVAVVLAADEAGCVLLARVAVGSCSAVARRLPELEAALVGCSLRDDLSACVEARHLAALTPIDDVRATAAYRMDAALTLVRRALCECAGKF
jgi:CO/xanthine dehydrogenase FAD-binding subunit